MRQKDPRAGAFRFRGRGRVWARARVGAGAFSLFFASWLSCFVLWSGPVVWACGLGLWSGLVVWAFGLGLWSWLVVWAGGLGLWSWLVVWACGLGLWSGLLAWACGLGCLVHTGHGTNQVHALPISPRSPGVRSATLPAHRRPVLPHTDGRPPGPPEGFYAPGLLSW